MLAEVSDATSQQNDKIDQVFAAKLQPPPPKKK